MFFGQSVTRLRAPVILDRDNNQVRDWATATSDDLCDVEVQPVSQAEDNENRSATITGWRIFSRRGTDLDVLASDRIVHLDRTCEVVGDVARWYSPGGSVHHVEFIVREVAG